MSIYNYRLEISYKGTGYEGWQIQPKGHKTIQGTLNDSLKKIAKAEVTSIGSGRTDSGVHAFGQVVKVSIPLKIDGRALVRALNSHLPSTIRVIRALECEESFHPIFSAKWKRYDYLISTAEEISPFYSDEVTHIPRKIDWGKFREALSCFQGEHDFENFSTKGTEVKTTLRTIYKTSLEVEDWSVGPITNQRMEVYRVSFEGNGFLKQMVRLLVGASLHVGLGKASVDDLREYMTRKSEQKFGAVAPADGLYLVHVEYNEEHPSIR